MGVAIALCVAGYHDGSAAGQQVKHTQAMPSLLTPGSCAKMLVRTYLIDQDRLLQQQQQDGAQCKHVRSSRSLPACIAVGGTRVLAWPGNVDWPCEDAAGA